MRVPDFAALHKDGKLRLVERDASTLLRLTRRPATELYFGRNEAARFDDPLQHHGVAYVARSLEVAFAEAVLHDSALYDAGAWIMHRTRRCRICWCSWAWSCFPTQTRRPARSLSRRRRLSRESFDSNKLVPEGEARVQRLIERRGAK